MDEKVMLENILENAKESKSKAFPEGGTNEEIRDFLKGSPPQEMQKYVQVLLNIFGVSSLADLPNEIINKLNSILGSIK